MGLGGSDKIKDKSASGVYTFIQPKESTATIKIPQKEEFVVTQTQQPIKEIIQPKEITPPKKTPIVEVIKQVEVKKEQAVEVKIVNSENKNVQTVKTSNYIPKPNVYIPTREYRQMLKQVKRSRRR